MRDGALDRLLEPNVRIADTLAKLAEDPERVFTKHELLRAVWGGEPTGSRMLDSHACRLRNRLRDAGAPDTGFGEQWNEKSR